jgi:hypothetical protein
LLTEWDSRLTSVALNSLVLMGMLSSPEGVESGVGISNWQLYPAFLTIQKDIIED